MNKDTTEYVIDKVGNDLLASYFKLLGDPTRLRLIRLLLHGELCVNDIAAKLEMEQSAVSHQLRILKSANVVESKRNGKSICYSLCDKKITEILGVAESD